MKKILILIPIVALIMAILPQAQAGDQAGLKVMVKFDINHPPYWVAEPPADYKVIEGDLVEIAIAAADPDGDLLIFKCVRLENGQVIEQLPMLVSSDGLAKLRWEVPVGLNLDAQHELEFIAQEASYEYYDSEDGLKINARTKLIITPRTISIEIYPAELALNVKLGEKASQILTLKNAGTVPVNVDTGYAPYDANGDGRIDDMDLMGIRPGLQPGIDVYATALGTSIIPPQGRLNLDRTIGVGEAADNPFTYLAPTGLSEGIPEIHGFAIDFRAWAQ